MSSRTNELTKRTVTSIRLSEFEKKQLEIRSKELGYNSLSSYIRALVRNDANRESTEKKRIEVRERKPFTIYHKTRYGQMVNGDALDWMAAQKSSTANLIMTSPPFGLVRKKSYGNEDADAYCDWFKPFASEFHRILKDDGSLVIDIGGAWKPGTPTRSLYHFKLLIMLCEEFGFHLALEHYWWNPSKLPTPAEWVNVRRVRPKDAVNCVWWLSKTPYPKCSNRRVLVPYSDSMKSLIKNGYKPNTRPSGHVISKKFNRNNGGSVPPNLLAIANTESNGTYQDYCRQNQIPIHPARFPSALPEYFIRLTTDPGDLVIDPFGGSCVTGAVAEALKRNWACVELDASYLKGALARFRDEPITLASDKPSSYTVQTPCAIPIDEAQTPLVADGGKKRQKRQESTKELAQSVKEPFSKDAKSKQAIGS